MGTPVEHWKDRILAAHERVRPIVIETPIAYANNIAPEFSGKIALKLENLQNTGSFKLRGAANKIALLNPQQREAGVTTSSMGNHGLAVAVAAQAAGIPADVYLAPQVPDAKLEYIRKWGGTVHRAGNNALDAELAARRAAGETGKVYISPYNDADVVAGQGTIAVELVKQLPGLNAVFVAVGGGGLIGGIGAYLKAVSPKTQVVGCWPENSPVLYECLKQGRIFDVPERPTLSESTAGGFEPGSITLELGQKVIDQTILVTEDEILSAMRLVRDKKNYLIEGAAGVALAGFLGQADQFANQSVAIIICGGNLSPRVLQKLQQI